MICALQDLKAGGLDFGTLDLCAGDLVAIPHRHVAVITTCVPFLTGQNSLR